MANPFIEKREFPRYDANIQVRLTTHYCEFGGLLVNISGGGAMLRLDSLSLNLLSGNDLGLVWGRFGALPMTRRWRKDSDFGVSFDIAPDRKRALSDDLERQFASLWTLV